MSDPSDVTSLTGGCCFLTDRTLRYHSSNLYDHIFDTLCVLPYFRINDAKSLNVRLNKSFTMYYFCLKLKSINKGNETRDKLYIPFRSSGRYEDSLRKTHRGSSRHVPVTTYPVPVYRERPESTSDLTRDKNPTVTY